MFDKIESHPYKGVECFCCCAIENMSHFLCYLHCIKWWKKPYSFFQNNSWKSKLYFVSYPLPIVKYHVWFVRCHRTIFVSINLSKRIFRIFPNMVSKLLMELLLLFPMFFLLLVSNQQMLPPPLWMGNLIAKSSRKFPPMFGDLKTLPSSPYYKHPTENPSLILVSPPLTVSNYHSWSRSMRMALLFKNKLLLIDERTPTPHRSDAIFRIWERCNNLILSWILKSPSPTIAQSVLSFLLAKDVWRILRLKICTRRLF